MRVPRQIGRYEVGAAIGEGGFATVLKAWDSELESHVAIKVLHADLCSDDELVERFVAEARMLRRVHNPHIVAIHDIGRLDDERPYLVLDFANAGSLGDRLARAPGGADLNSIRRVVEAIASGLGDLHDHGIVHRDVKPANVLIASTNGGGGRGAHTSWVAPDALIDGRERILLSDLGLAKDVHRGEAPSVLGGTPGYQAPEQRLAGSTISAQSDIYGATAVVWHLLSGHAPPEQPTDADFADWPQGWRTVFRRGLAATPEDRFGSMIEWAAAVLEQLDVGPVETTSAAAIDGGGPNPYKGLEAFQPSDHELFIGREELTADLVVRLGTTRTLVVGGPSGSGKSSLIRAGLMPAVGEGALPRSDTWPMLLMVPGHQPLKELAYQLSSLAPTTSAISDDDLRREPREARRPIGAAVAAPDQLLLVIDQFEELFTHEDDPDDRVVLLAALEALTEATDSVTRLVIGLRADFYGACATSAWLAQCISSNQVLVGPMDRDDLRRAVEEPAHRRGARLEPGLADRVLADSAADARSLPLISHAMMQTWKARSGNQLTIEDYDATGGVTGAIAKTGDDLYNSFDRIHQDATRRLLLRLVTPGDGAVDTRRRIRHEEISNDREPKIQQEVVRKFIDARLLTVDETHLEIAHEALIQTWPRLRSWIDEERDNLRTRLRISRAAAEWDSLGRSPDLLYRRTALASALEWAQAHPDQLDTFEQSFLDAGREARDEFERSRAEQAKRRQRVRVAAITTLSILLVAALGATLIAVQALGESRDSEQLAQDRFGVSLGSQAVAVAAVDPFLALRLAAESLSQSGVDDLRANQALVEARRSLDDAGIEPIGAPMAVGDALTVVMSSDGRYLVVGGRDGDVQVWDSVTRTPLSEPIAAHENGVQEIAFVPGTDEFLSVGGESGRGELILWSIGEEGELGDPDIVLELADVIWSVDVTSDGQLVAIAAEDGTIRLFDLTTHQELDPPLQERVGDFLTVAFSPDDRVLVTGNGAGDINGFDVETREHLFGPIASQVILETGSDAWEIEFADDGGIAIAGAAYTVETASLAGLIDGDAPLDRPFGSDLRLQAVVFDNERGWILAGTEDGRVEIVDRATGARLATNPTAHDDAIIDAALAPDSNRLVTLSDDQTARMWLLGSGADASTTLARADTQLASFALDPTGGRMAAGTEDGRLLIWSTTGEVVADVAAHDGAVQSLAFGGSGVETGSIIVTGGADGTVAFWDASNGALVADPVDAHDGKIWSTIASPDGASVVTSGQDATIRVWSVDDRGPQSGPFPLPVESAAIAFSRTGSEIAAALWNGTVHFIDPSDGTAARDPIIVDPEALRGIVYHPVESRLATAAAQERVRQWQVNDGADTGAPLTGHELGAISIAYLGDGEALAVGDGRGGLHLWHSASGTQLSPSFSLAEGDPSPELASAIAVVTDPTSPRSFLTASRDGTIRHWDLLDVGRACELAKGLFDDARLLDSLGPGAMPSGCA